MSLIAKSWGVIVSIMLIGVAVALTVGGEDRHEERVADGIPRLVDAETLVKLEETLDHDIFWAGERPPNRIEATEEPDGNVYLRYLPPDVEPGDPRAGFLTVGTYPVSDAVGTLRRVAGKEKSALERIGDAFVLGASSEGSAYLAEPGSDLQIEVYHPRPGQALDLIHSGAIRPVG
jgi:hypothetical protein